MTSRGLNFLRKDANDDFNFGGEIEAGADIGAARELRLDSELTPKSQVNLELCSKLG